MSSQRRVLATPDGPYVVYHRDTAGSPEAHKDPAGPWYFQPADYDAGEVFSRGYPDAGAAENAAFDFAQQALAERQQLEEERQADTELAPDGMQQLSPSPGPERLR